MYPTQILKIMIGFIFIGESGFKPIMGKSLNWKHWVSMLGLTTCIICRNHHGKIYGIDEESDIEIPVHLNCKCVIVAMDTIAAGTATIKGLSGADWYLKSGGDLPNNYITKDEAEDLGWLSKLGNLTMIAPNMIIGGDVYSNKNLKLPVASNRIWYEADINYITGYRNTHRVLYSNDGLIFVTYDHYETFYEII